MKDAEVKQNESDLLPDFTDVDQLRKVFIASEILARKY